MPRNTRPTTAYPVTLRELEVHRVTEVTPGMRRVTLTGAQLDTFTNADGIAEPAFTSTRATRRCQRTGVRRGCGRGSHSVGA
ncbi:hypothetical protein R3Q06_26035 [Rhodococcus erythropolis]|uniref:hypothetical protein n=1 Tax=Rhodococcus erythropolis TaxID=1833 RepID=UPI00294926EB|nr:hypothetical protein [Rhodococcus erythropolis]MDV6276960.1 hypothetical protein [Rhodococcus erythropolis]